MDNASPRTQIVNGRHVEILTPGCITWTWCHVHGVRVAHLWTGRGFVCLECHPEAKPK